MVGYRFCNRTAATLLPHSQFASNWSDGSKILEDVDFLSEAEMKEVQ